MVEWEHIKHFSPKENWGDPDKMDPELLNKLDLFREEIGKKCKVLSGFATSGHAPKSYHYLGKAVDCRFMDENGIPLSLWDHFLIAMKAPFNGVGIYSHSNWGPFLHFDVRESSERKIWVCEKEGQYRPLSPLYMKRMLEAS